MVILASSDNVQFIVDKEVAEQSILIKNMLEDVGESDQAIPLLNVTSRVLKKVLEYCEHYRGKPPPINNGEADSADASDADKPDGADDLDKPDSADDVDESGSTDDGDEAGDIDDGDEADSTDDGYDSDSTDYAARSYKRPPDIPEWDQKFITVDREILFGIILAANYLDIKPLLDLGCKAAANMLIRKTPEEIRTLFL